MKAIKKTHLVYVTIPIGATAGARISFNDVPELREKRICGLEAYTDNMLGATPDNVTTITQADQAGVSITLKCGSEERIQAMPAATLFPINTGGIWKEFIPFIVNWGGSYIQLSTTPAALPCSLPLNVFYED